MIRANISQQSAGEFNTLVQNETSPPQIQRKKKGVVINGKGSDLLNEKSIKGRAKRKLITQKMILSLIDIAKEKENKILEKGLWNTYHCLEKVHVYNGRIYGKFCKNRFCTVCCAIRKAEIINKYFPVIEKWDDPHFVTITCKAVKADRLKPLMKSLNRGIKRIIEKYRKRNSRGKGIKLMGIRSLESNFNPIKKTYNPHFHLIVPSKEIGDIIINEWLTTSKNGLIGKAAQTNIKIANNLKCLMEVVKYGSKIFTEPDVNNKSKQNSKRDIYVRALYTIFEAMQGFRIFDRFGFDLPKDDCKKIRQSIQVNDYKEFIYDLSRADWFDINSNTPLTHFKPDQKISELLEKCINNELN